MPLCNAFVVCCSAANCCSAAAAFAALERRRRWKEIVFNTYHVALGLAVVTVCGSILDLQVRGNGALGGHLV
jgi:hypothetical protein